MIPKKDIKIECVRGQGPGGQHRNKTSSCVKMTHIPTGVNVTIDGRYQAKNKRVALRELENRLIERKRQSQAGQKKAIRDKKIHERDIVRTYHFPRGVVKDHRTGMTASIKQIMDKGSLDLLRRTNGGGKTRLEIQAENDLKEQTNG